VVRSISRLVALCLLAAAGLGTVFIVGMRTKAPVVIDGVRRFNRAVTNPLVLRSAGSPGASASVIRHVGRRSGLTYQTPVGPSIVGEAIVIALPYGRRADWVRNVVASGAAMLIHEGRIVSLRDPELVSTGQVMAELPSSEQRTLRVSKSTSACGFVLIRPFDRSGCRWSRFVGRSTTGSEVSGL
jgi:deazaflavin-dependent oxidoreductase (nitroreductase family)